MVHAPQASVRQVDLVRILAAVVAADVFVGAGHAARLEPPMVSDESTLCLQCWHHGN
jgi:hypothetical protein